MRSCRCAVAEVVGWRLAGTSMYGSTGGHTPTTLRHPIGQRMRRRCCRTGSSTPRGEPRNRLAVGPAAPCQLHDPRQAAEDTRRCRKRRKSRARWGIGCTPGARRGIAEHGRSTMRSDHARKQSRNAHSFARHEREHVMRVLWCRTRHGS